MVDTASEILFIIQERENNACSQYVLRLPLQELKETHEMKWNARISITRNRSWMQYCSCRKIICFRHGFYSAGNDNAKENEISSARGKRTF